MFGFPRRRTKHGRLKLQLPDSDQGTKSPIQHPKRKNNTNNEVAVTNNHMNEVSCQGSSEVAANNCSTGNSENWMVLSVAGDKPAPRFNHAAAVIGNKMVVVGGESGNRLLDDVQVLDFDRFTWATLSSKIYFSPGSLPLKIPACKGHCLVSWGKKALMIGGKTDPRSDKISVWAFDIDTECWSLVEAKGDIPVARSGHTVVRASSVLILFGGEDTKRRKLNDLHMFDLKSSMWLPLHGTGTAPSPRSNHVASLYDDKTLLIFGGASKSRTLNDLYSLDFETMIWSRIKKRGFHPSPRAGCCGVLCGSRWYIAGGGSKKKRHPETLIFDVLKVEWSVSIVSPPSSITTHKGFSLVHVQHKEKDFLVAFGGTRKESSNQVEVLVMEKNERPTNRQNSLNKGRGPSLFENQSSFPNVDLNCASQLSADSMAIKNLALAIKHHGSGRKSLSDSLLVDPSSVAGNSLRKQFHNHEDNRTEKCSEDGSFSGQAAPERGESHFDTGVKASNPARKNKPEAATSFPLESKNLNPHIQGNILQDNVDAVFQEGEGKPGPLSAPSSIYQLYETKMASLIKKNGVLEGQLAAALASQEGTEMSLSSVLKSKQDMEKKLADTVKEKEVLKEKLSGMELAQEEASSLSNIVHSDNVRLEHDVAFLKAVLDDTQKELHSTRGVLAGERTRAFQLQVEVFHLKQRLQSVETRVPTPTRKPFHVQYRAT